MYPSISSSFPIHPPSTHHLSLSLALIRFLSYNKLQLSLFSSHHFYLLFIFLFCLAVIQLITYICPSQSKERLSIDIPLNELLDFISHDSPTRVSLSIQYIMRQVSSKQLNVSSSISTILSRMDSIKNVDSWKSFCYLLKSIWYALSLPFLACKV